MKFISADYIFPISSPPIKNGVIAIKDKTIKAVLTPENDTIPENKVKKYKGILCPGFVNSHCHLELSYLKNQLQQKTKLHGFVNELMEKREHVTEDERIAALKDADKEMYKNGIVAVGDISNGKTSFNTKSQSKIKYHTFVEVFGLDSNEASHIIKNAQRLVDDYFDKTRVSITAHAPYSMSDELKKQVNQLDGKLLSIHNQETASENQLYKEKKGFLYEQMAKLSNEIKTWQPTGKNSLPSYLPSFSAYKKIQLVHNTYTSSSDIEYAKNTNNQIFWCFCPNANLFIEDSLPNIDLFKDEKCTIGTDSLASNLGLCILEELKIITKHFPTIELEKLLQWATLNGAEFLGFQNTLGSFDEGKKPGINLIENVDLENFRLQIKSKVLKVH